MQLIKAGAIAYIAYIKYYNINRCQSKIISGKIKKIKPIKIYAIASQQLGDPIPAGNITGIIASLAHRTTKASGD